MNLLNVWCLSRVRNTANWSSVSRESFTRSQNQGIPVQPVAIRMTTMLYCLIFNNCVEDSCQGRGGGGGGASICYQGVTFLVVVITIYYFWLSCFWRFFLKTENVIVGNKANR